MSPLYDEWTEKVEAYRRRTRCTKTQAIAAIDAKHPGLRIRMLAEINDTTPEDVRAALGCDDRGRRVTTRGKSQTRSTR